MDEKGLILISVSDHFCICRWLKTVPSLSFRSALLSAIALAGFLLLGPGQAGAAPCVSGIKISAYTTSGGYICEFGTVASVRYSLGTDQGEMSLGAPLANVTWSEIGNTQTIRWNSTSSDLIGFTMGLSVVPPGGYTIQWHPLVWTQDAPGTPMQANTQALTPTFASGNLTISFDGYLKATDTFVNATSLTQSITLLPTSSSPTPPPIGVPEPRMLGILFLALGATTLARYRRTA